MRFVTVSHDLRRWLIDVIGIAASQVVTIHNGVDPVRFTDDGDRAARTALGLPLDAVVAGTVGRLDPVKDQIGVLEAFACLRDKWPRALLVIVGDGPCRGALEARSRRPDLVGRVRLLGERADVPDILRAIDIYMLPSIAEGISNTVLEAMASGLPVIATAVGGNPELVDDGVTGTLVPVGDRPALAGALAAYLGDPHLRMVHGKAGRARAATEFSLERMAQRYRALYLDATRRMVA
jgi:glycosyltransferase involved in cell wall biosynthesis